MGSPMDWQPDSPRALVIPPGRRFNVAPVAWPEAQFMQDPVPGRATPPPVLAPRAPVVPAPPIQLHHDPPEDPLRQYYDRATNVAIALINVACLAISVSVTAGQHLASAATRAFRARHARQVVRAPQELVRGAMIVGGGVKRRCVELFSRRPPVTQQHILRDARRIRSPPARRRPLPRTPTPRNLPASFPTSSRPRTPSWVAPATLADRAMTEPSPSSDFGREGVEGETSQLAPADAVGLSSSREAADESERPAKTMVRDGPGRVSTFEASGVPDSLAPRDESVRRDVLAWYDASASYAPSSTQRAPARLSGPVEMEAQSGPRVINPLGFRAAPMRLAEDIPTTSPQASQRPAPTMVVRRLGTLPIPTETSPPRTFPSPPRAVTSQATHQGASGGGRRPRSVRSQGRTGSPPTSLGHVSDGLARLQLRSDATDDKAHDKEVLPPAKSAGDETGAPKEPGPEVSAPRHTAGDETGPSPGGLLGDLTPATTTSRGSRDTKEPQPAPRTPSRSVIPRVHWGGLQTRSFIKGERIDYVPTPSTGGLEGETESPLSELSPGFARVLEEGLSPLGNQVGELDSPVVLEPELSISGRTRKAREVEETTKAQEKAAKAARAAKVAREAAERAAEAERARQRRQARVMPAAPVIAPLTAEWEAKVAAAMRSGPSKELAWTSTGVPISRRDLGTVLPTSAADRTGGWLNDEVINAYLQAVVDHGLRQTTGGAGRRGRQGTPKFHAFNSFFYSNLRGKGPKSVSRWTTKAHIGGKTLLDVERVFIPVHNGNHWTLLVVSPVAKTIEYFDSLDGPPGQFIAQAKLWLREELGALYVDRDWRVLNSPSPQQSNSLDCGVFTVTTAKMVLLGIDPMAYGPRDIPLQRRRMVAELINGGFSGVFAPAAT
ncbi:MAG: hypothetical protein M1838_000823 [Thelocarpon superellum]|nr:MAG: hypothetical protein M1838_000823 [Thelocarpon superellum]